MSRVSMGLKMRLSSAKIVACVSEVRRASERSFMKSKKKRGPSTLPWGDTRRDRGVVRASAVEENTLSPIGQKSSDPVKSLSS